MRVKVLPKNTVQCPRPSLESRLLDQESSALAMRPPHLSLAQNSIGKNAKRNATQVSRHNCASNARLQAVSLLLEINGEEHKTSERARVTASGELQCCRLQAVHSKSSHIMHASHTCFAFLHSYLSKRDRSQFIHNRATLFNDFWY